MVGVPRACSLPAAAKPLVEESESPLQSSDTVLDLRLLAGAGSASLTQSGSASLTQSDCDTTPLPSSGCSSPRVSEQTDDAGADPTEAPGWQEACELLDAGLAALLQAGASVTSTELKVAECSAEEGSHTLRLRTDASCSTVPLAEACSSRVAESPIADMLKGDDVRGLAHALAPGTLVGRSWATQPLPIGPAPLTPASKFASQTLGALQHAIPEDLLPTAASNWLAHGPLATAAVQLQLRGASGLVPLQPAAAELQTISLLLSLGARCQAAGAQSCAEPGQRMLLRPGEHEAPDGRSLGWQLCVARAGAEPAVGRLAAAVEQGPGQLHVQQAHARCCLAGGSLSLSWNVASGAQWPAQALARACARSDALREAAAAARNPWHAAEAGPQRQQLHVLRLLFFAACCVPKVHCDVLAGLQRHLLPLCRRELATQAAPGLPQINARPGALEDGSPGAMRCSCCGGEFVFSYVRLIERREERAGELCWACWGRRQDIGLCDAGPPRNARNCTVIPPRDVQRLICLLERGAPAKRPAPGA